MSLDPSSAREIKPNAELVANLKMRRRLGEFKATDTDIENALRDSNNVFRQAITFLKTGRKARHIKGESKIGLANSLAAEFVNASPRASLAAQNAPAKEGAEGAETDTDVNSGTTSTSKSKPNVDGVGASATKNESGS